METTQAPSPTGLQPLDPAIRTIWTIKYVILFGLLVLGAFFIELVQFFTGAERTIPIGTYTIALLVVGGLISFGLPRLRYRFWRFALRTDELYLERGIFNRVRTIVPLRRIQHLDVSQDLIEREFALGKLIVHTAGSRSSDVVVPGLNIEEAERLRDDVKRYVMEDAL